MRRKEMQNSNNRNQNGNEGGNDKENTQYLGSLLDGNKYR